MIWIAVLSAVVVLGGLLGLNYWRSRSPFDFELEPNCLLTRYPLLFLSGKRSLLYFQDYWNNIPKFLSSHSTQPTLEKFQGSPPTPDRLPKSR